MTTCEQLVESGIWIGWVVTRRPNWLLRLIGVQTVRVEVRRDTSNPCHPLRYIRTGLEAPRWCYRAVQQETVTRLPRMEART